MTAAARARQRASQERHRALLRGGLALLCAAAAACGEPVDGRYGDPTAAVEALEQQGLSVRLVTPAVGAVLGATDVVLAVQADDLLSERPPQIVVEANGRRVWDRAPTYQEGATTSRHALGVLHGITTARVIVQSADGVRRAVLEVPLRMESAAPGIAVLALAAPADGPCGATGDGGWIAATDVCVAGRLSTVGAGIARVSVQLQRPDGSPLAPPVEAPFESRGAGWTFAADLLGASDEPAQLVIEALDARGGRAVLAIPVWRDATPPALVVDQARTALRTSAERVALTGRVDDPAGVERVCVRPADAPEALPRCAPLQDREFVLDVPVAVGTTALVVEARDGAGNLAAVPIEVQRTRQHRLAPPRRDATPVGLELDRDALVALLDEQTRQDLLLVELDLMPELRAALRALREPGRYGIDTDAWGQAEWNLWRLLTVSPDTIELAGTSIEEVAIISESIGLPIPRVLAALLDQPVDAPILTLDVATAVLAERFVGTHPNVRLGEDRRPRVAITLADVLADLAPLGERLGPAGDHPGVLGGAPEGRVLETGFALWVEARSELTRLEGLDATRASVDWWFRPDDGPSLVLDFLGEDTFRVVGLVYDPTVSLRLVLQEDPRFLRAGTQRDAGPVPGRGGEFLGNGEVWETPPWVLEHLVAEIAWRTYVDAYAETDRQRSWAFAAGNLADAATFVWERGWLTTRTVAGVGNPPAPVYVWDLLAEAAQIRLHDGGLAEGDANVAFDLPNIPIGLDADALIEAMRPALQAQAPQIVAQLVGVQAQAGPRVDVVVDLRDGAPFLVHRWSGPDTSDGVPAGFCPTLGCASPSGSPDAAGYLGVPAEAGARWVFADGEGTWHALQIDAVESNGTVVVTLVAPAEDE